MEGLVVDLVVALGLVGNLVADWEDFANVLKDLVEVVHCMCAVEDLCLEEGLDPVAGLQVLLPLVVLMEGLALEDSVLQAFFCHMLLSESVFCFLQNL